MDGSIGELGGHLIHHSFNKGIQDWLEKHVRYAFLEARENMKCLSESDGLDWRGMVNVRDPVRRRRSLKALSCHMPFRPLLRFLYGYLWPGGLLHGRAGFTYCRMIAMYEYMIVLSVRELRRREKGLAV